MKQKDQVPDIRKQFAKFMGELRVLSNDTVMDIIRTNTTHFYQWQRGFKNPYLDIKIEAFLNGDGLRFLELTKQLKTAKTDRVALHQERAAILQKARIHVPSKHGVPSLAINN